MEIIVHTEAGYDAAHHLDEYIGPCKNIHGHTYKIEVWVKADEDKLQPNGILWDFGNLKKAITEFDHNGDMTKVMGYNSTAENQALYFYKKFKTVNPELNFKVRVYEQLYPKKSWAEVGNLEGDDE